MLDAQAKNSNHKLNTDGSKTDQGTGYGFLITINDNADVIHTHSAKLPDYCSVYQAELSAITAAAEWLMGYVGNSIVFFTDSQAGLNSMNKTTLNSNTAISCHRALNIIAARNTVTVMWVAGHEGHWGNEQADSLAKTGAETGEPSKGYLPQSYIKQAINNIVREQDANTWTLKGPRHSRLALNNNKPHLKNLKMLLNNRRDYRTAVQLITGQAGLYYHLYKIHQVSTKTCPKCNMEDETVSHFLGQCPYYAATRAEVFNDYYTTMTDIFERYSILQIVKYANKTGRLRYDATGAIRMGSLLRDGRIFASIDLDDLLLEP